MTKRLLPAISAVFAVNKNKIFSIYSITDKNNCFQSHVLTKCLFSGIMTVQPNKTYESLVRYITRMMRECGIRLLFFSAGMHFDKQIKESKSLRGYCQGIPIQFSRRDFYLINRKELTINMDAVLILKCYPAGIGKHIVCIDAGSAAVLQTACRGEPRTPSNKATGNKRR